MFCCRPACFILPELTQDKDVAFRVFELGIKKFGGEAGYLLAYLDHISHLNGEEGVLALRWKIVSGVTVVHCRGQQYTCSVREGTVFHSNGPKQV